MDLKRNAPNIENSILMFSYMHMTLGT